MSMFASVHTIPIRRRLVALSVMLLFGDALPAQLPAAPASSRSPVHIGGYAAVTVTRASDTSSIRLAEANVAAILSGSLTARLSYLAELDAVSSSRENYAGRQEDRQLEFARLYAELSRSDLLRLRVGRFLTPVGQWNEIHAEPLTWAAVRPLATYRSFAKYSTGALVAGQGALLGRDAGYAVWGAPVLPWLGRESDEPELEFRGAFGARVAIEAVHGLWVGASVASVRSRRPSSSFDDDEHDDPEDEPDEAPEPPEPPGLRQALGPLPSPDSHESPEQEDREERYSRGLLGFDLTARIRGVELRAEATYLRRGITRPAEQTAFAQVAVPVVRGLHAVIRVEDASPLARRHAQFWSAGLHFRGPAGFVLKLERQDAATAPRAVANGWFLSVSSRF